MAYEYSCIMLEIDCPQWESILKMIDPNDLSENEKSLEKETHIIILYGITVDTEEKPIKEVVNNWRKPEFIVDEVGLFENPEFDVLKFNIRSNDLNAYWINAKQELENESKFQLYSPHITIAYLKKGEGKKYLTSNKFKIDEYQFIPKKWKISFGGEEREPLFLKFNNKMMKFDEFSIKGESYRSKFISGHANDFYNFTKNKEIMDLENSKKEQNIKESNSNIN